MQLEHFNISLHFAIVVSSLCYTFDNYLFDKIYFILNLLVLLIVEKLCLKFIYYIYFFVNESKVLEYLLNNHLIILNLKNLYKIMINFFLSYFMLNKL